MPTTTTICMQDMLVLTHQRAKVCLRMDQPLAAIELYSSAYQRHPADISLLLGQARIQEALGQHAESLATYQQVRAQPCHSAAWRGTAWHGRAGQSTAQQAQDGHHMAPDHTKTCWHTAMQDMPVWLMAPWGTLPRLWHAWQKHALSSTA